MSALTLRVRKSARINSVELKSGNLQPKENRLVKNLLDKEKISKSAALIIANWLRFPLR